MKGFLEALNILAEKYQPYNLFNRFTADENVAVRAYSSYINLLWNSTSTINHFATMKPPKNLEERYLVVWGALQAFIIQQDAIFKLHNMFVEAAKKKGFKLEDRAWQELRHLRDTVAGHPTRDANMVMIVAKDDNDWGVLVEVEAEATPIHSYICDRLEQYETELLEAFKLIANGLDRGTISVNQAE